MPDLIPQHYSTEFSSNWIHRVQQTKSRLDEFVVSENYAGERKRYDRLYAQNSSLRTERKAPTPIVDPGMDSRWAVRKSFQIGNLLDKDDALNLGPLVMPTSDYVKSHAAAYNRDSDDIAWQSALDPVLTGEQGLDPVVLPGSQKIVHGGTGLTLEKLLAANEILEAADLGDDMPRVMLVTPRQLTNLLSETEITSADYTTVKALVNGQIDTFLGFKFVKITRLRKAANIRTCVAWVKGAIRTFTGPMSSSIDQRADLSYATQIYSTWHLGATRVYDEGVVQVDCSEA
jgi:hypothetical protein